MRLLRRASDGSYKLTRDFQTYLDLPEYAILSHRWLPDDGEIDFQEMSEGIVEQKPAGYAKLRFCGEQAARDGLDHFWVDTCCIDKKSSQELKRTVNSMFKWYKRATKCYAYLVDVSATKVDESHRSQPWEASFRESEWFKRGWTLQELLAPACVEFYSREGVRLGDKRSLEDWIVEITGISGPALQGKSPSDFTVEERLSWAEGRDTTYPEDKWYSLLGLFDVRLSLHYDEGGDKARTRLIDSINAEQARLSNVLVTLPVSSAAAFNSMENAKDDCLPDTRVDLLRKIDEWANRSDDRHIFWLYGMAGTGKSAIARTVSRSLHTQGKLGGTFFFSSKGGSEVSDATRLVTTLASQMATKISPVKFHICNALSKHGDIAKSVLHDQWDELIIQPLKELGKSTRPSTIVLVIDALDECNSSKHVRMFLRSLATTKELRELGLRILITSRPDISIRVEFDSIPENQRQDYTLHDIEKAIVDQDIALFFRHKLNELRKGFRFGSRWPSENDIQRLVENACSLFVWASTAYLWIANGGKSAKSRLNKLVRGGHSHADTVKPLDKIYITVLRESIPSGGSGREAEHSDDPENDEEERQDQLKNFRTIVGTIVVLSVPLSLQSLASLLNVETELVSGTLADLHAIFDVPEDSSRPIRVHHPTFREFLLDRKRRTDDDFWIDEKVAHKKLAESCVRLMSEKLERNICLLPSPGTLVQEINRDEIEQYVPQQLQYACLYWVEHLRQGGTRLRDHDHVHKFFNEHFLHWLEVLSLMGKGSEMGRIMRIYQSLLAPADNSIQNGFVNDARSFMARFQPSIEEAPLQVYCAAQIFIPPTNTLRRHFWGQFNAWLQKVWLVEADAPEIEDEYNYVSDLAFTPDGKQLASGSLKPSVRVWNVATRAASTTYEGQTDKISSVAISPNGGLLASGSDSNMVTVWNMPSKTTCFIANEHTRWVNTVAFSPDGKLLASGSMDETIRVWDVATGEQLHVWEPQMSCINSIAFSPDGRLLAVGTADGTLPLYDVETKRPERTLDNHTGPINSVQFATNGKRIVSGSDDLTIRVWDASTWSETKKMSGHSRRIWAVTFSRDSRVIASGSEDKTIRLWNADTGTQSHVLTGHSSGVNAVLFSPNSLLLASGSFNDEVRLWDARTAKPLGQFADFENDAVPGASRDDEDTLPDSNVYGDSVASFKAHSSKVDRLVFSPDAQNVASGSHDSTIKIWTREGVEKQALRGHSGGISDLQFMSNGSRLISASTDETVRSWDVTSGSVLSTLGGHPGAVRRMRLSSDERFLATSSTDQKVRLWNASSGRLLRMLESHQDTVNDIAFSPDGNTIASCSADMTICVWDVRSDKGPLRSMKGHTACVNSIAFSQDGKLVVSTSLDHTVRTWDLNGKARHTFSEHGNSPISAMFSDNKERVVSSSEAGTVTLWNAETGHRQGAMETGVALCIEEFSGEDIKTDRGVIRSDALLSGAPLNHPRATPALFATKEWVKRDTKNTLWLRDEYSATSVATRDMTIVLGHASGAISFVDF